MVSGPEDQPLPVNKVKEERVKVAINPEHPEQTVMIDSNLTEKARIKMCNLLQRSLDVFAWTPADMMGVPIRQNKRGQAAERNTAINDEVSKLVATGYMREVHYHDWLSNPVMVKKNDNSWRMCVDFKDLNKACPKDGYPLPEIDWKVESLCGFPFKCFLDAYKGYHQIQMAEEDEEKIVFITNQGIFCYTKMPFGLRNTGATYQRLVDKIFHGQISKNLEVYVDDLVIKSRTEDEVVHDIEETFRTLRKINMKLNPKKCTFGVEEGMFLGYQVNTKGIKICPDKTKKELIAKLPMLTAPEEKEELVIYLATSKEAVSVVLMTEREAKQMPIYFVSRALRGPKVNYTSMEKLVLALVNASKRQRRPEEEDPDDSAKEEEPLPAQWTLFTDGSSCVDGCGAGVVLTDPKGTKFTYALRFQFEATNNEVEYEALIAGLRIAENMGVQNLQCFPGVFDKTGSKKRKQSRCTEQNGIYQLRTSQQAGASRRTKRKIRERKKARAIKQKSQRFAIINGILYKKSFLGPWLRCVGPSQANYVLREIHEGSCSMHAGTRSVVAKALRIGYYWSTMHKDARALIKACPECQVHKPVKRNPQERLNPITCPWPFHK
ncbi:reverse transcriptase domain-containing protein [Tanacetum coccineum]